MVSKTHTMTLVKSKNKTIQIVRTSFTPEQKLKIFLFSVIATKVVDVLFDQNIDNI